MKNILFYILLLFQILAVLLIVLQYNLIDSYGEERTFITQPFVDEYNTGVRDDDILDYETYTFDFEINEIPANKWDGKEVNDYRANAYVLLKENEDGIYEVLKASDQEITSEKTDEIVLIGKNIYEREENMYYVNYGFETINVENHQEKLSQYKQSEKAKVTYKFAPWKQSKLIKIE